MNEENNQEAMKQPSKDDNPEAILHKVHRKIAEYALNDGIMEMTLGYFVIAFALHALWYPHLPLNFRDTLIFILLIPLVPLSGIKKKFQNERVGTILLDSKRTSGGFLIIIIGLVGLLSVYLRMVFSGTPDSLPSGITGGLFMAAIPFIILGSLATFMKITRLYFHTIILTIGCFLWAYLDMNYSTAYATVALGIAGGLVMVIGSVVLKKFINENPVMEEEED
jgi:hypothetical protein